MAFNSSQCPETRRCLRHRRMSLRSQLCGKRGRPPPDAAGGSGCLAFSGAVCQITQAWCTTILRCRPAFLLCRGSRERCQHLRLPCLRTALTCSAGAVSRGRLSPPAGTLLAATGRGRRGRRASAPRALRTRISRPSASCSATSKPSCDAAWPCLHLNFQLTQTAWNQNSEGCAIFDSRSDALAQERAIVCSQECCMALASAAAL
jgi:hypothetical protein